MLTVFFAVMLIIAGTILMCLYRVVVGPGVFNRIAAVSVIGTKVVVLLVIIFFYLERPIFVDVAIAYASLNFIGTLLISKYLEKGEVCSKW
ncbi:MAG: monovalent cation/H+ antiporter complex subunit F [Candidatus Methanospirareceae archaeon]